SRRSGWPGGPGTGLSNVYRGTAASGPVRTPSAIHGTTASSGCTKAAIQGLGARPAIALVRDADPQPAKPLALVLDLHHLYPADLAGGGHVRAAVRLLVQPDDVDDADLLDLGRDQVGGGPDDVGEGECLLPRQHPDVDPPVGRDLGVAGRLDRIPEAL